MKKQLLAFILFLVVICHLFAEPNPNQIIEYKSIKDIKLTLHVFNPENHQVSDKTPGIVFFFGGGWKTGDPTHFYKQSAYLASRGMVAICADYRTEKRHGTTPAECVKDGKSAIRWIRSHAAELGINPDKLAAGGGSAGGQVAAATGTVSGFNEADEDTSVSCIPNALVLFNPVYDNSPEGYGFDRVKDYWQSFSPLHNLNQKTPPTLVLLGTKDQLVPVLTAKEYKRRMEVMGIRCDLHLYDGQKHGFFNKIKYNETVLEMDKFLVSLWFLQGEPTIKL